MDAFLTFIGRFHPLIVHLPIGFIVLGVLMEGNRKKFKFTDGVLQFVLFWIIVSGLFSLVTGYFQYTQEGHLWESISAHLFVGCITVLLAIAFYVFLNGNKRLASIPRPFFSIALLLSIVITGHLGGNITHGEAHLTEPLEVMTAPIFGKDEKEAEFFLDVDTYKGQALYSAVIDPILSKKCVSCHNPKKTKGELQMHQYEALVKGGKNGSILDFENSEQSELFIRIHMPLSEEKHMPPKARKQLSKAEINVISNWIERGAPQKETIAELGISYDLIVPFMKQVELNPYPDVVLDPPNQNAIASIQAKNIIIAPVNRASNFLTLSSINNPNFSTQDLLLLESLYAHIVEIDLSYSAVDDTVFETLSQFPNLVQIKLDHTQVTGKGLALLQQLKHLKKLHLVDTNLEASELNTLLDFPILEQVYIFQSTRDLTKEIELPIESLSLFEFGNYSLPELPSDQIVY